MLINRPSQGDDSTAHGNSPGIQRESESADVKIRDSVDLRQSCS